MLVLKIDEQNLVILEYCWISQLYYLMVKQQIKLFLFVNELQKSMNNTCQFLVPFFVYYLFFFSSQVLRKYPLLYLIIKCFFRIVHKFYCLFNLKKKNYPVGWSQKPETHRTKILKINVNKINKTPVHKQ